MNRYEGKPFLRLLECYVLSAIDELTDEQKTALSALEPKLHELYGVQGNWSEVVAAQMDFPESLAGKIREIWRVNSEKFAAAGAHINAEDFAKNFVDTNFPPAP
ncbi:hypothetical protein HX792_18530 [Pseudomonas sp. B6002]|uniref:hypothetical protein n=1 Tax=Pseudomonas sp. B6002 TaxID=2726978 RepID=UPI0015A07451|nr:hypothetical protein [Pseudomonas sp. B6002]NVZ52347.1 hypothetical protein [Pseudomonas sp. B6002]